MVEIACYLCGSALPGYLASVLPSQGTGGGGEGGVQSHRQTGTPNKRLIQHILSFRCPQIFNEN
jgi:hypothetical protein